MKHFYWKSISIFSACLLLTLMSFAYAQPSDKPEFLAPTPSEPSPTPESGLLDHLKQEIGATLRISYHPRTGKLLFLGTSPQNPIRRPASLTETASVEEAAISFLRTYGDAFWFDRPG